MSMMVDWEYFFPDVYFKHDRFETWSKEDLNKVLDENGRWDPQKDFEFHLQKLKVNAIYFDENNNNLFPEGFRKPRYSIETFEEARLNLLSRVQISFIEERETYSYNEENAEETCNVYQTYKIEIEESDKRISVESGTTIGSSKRINQDGTFIETGERELRVWGRKNVITCHRFNAINLLYDWLIGLNPRGAYDNNWQVFAYGISEYDETLSHVDTFIINFENAQTSLPGFKNENNNIIVTQTIESNLNNIVEYRKEGAIEIRQRIKEWNPFI